MYSPEITQAPVTLFLGAGASKPFGKMLMTEFINSLAFDKRFNSSPLYSQIIQEKPDLEFLFEQLEQWKEKGYAERQSGRPTLGYVQPTGIVNHAQELLIALREKVFDAYRDIDAPSRIKTVRIFNELLDGIFNDLEQSQYPVVIFTTNYDPAVEIYCEESKSYVLEDGFREEAGAFVWRRESFDRYKVAASKKHAVLFKLHGSEVGKKGWANTKTAISHLCKPRTGVRECCDIPSDKKGGARRSLLHSIRLFSEDYGRVWMLHRHWLLV